MITLSDLNKLQAESQTGRGWIACTTDAIFLEKPAHYDLLLDLTTSTPDKSTCPTFYSSQPIEPVPLRGATHRLSTIRFAWSNVKLWNKLDRILQLDPSHSHHNSCCTPMVPNEALKSKYVSAWTDVWWVYEDVCLVCAGLWMGSWCGNSTSSYSTANGARNWGSIHLEGDDDLTFDGFSEGGQMRNLGQGIKGRPADLLAFIENGPTSSQKQKHHASSQHTSTSVCTVDNEEEIDKLDADDEVLGGDGMIIEETPAADLLACTTVHPLALPTLDSLALLQRQLEDITADLRFQRKTNQDLCREYDSIIRRLREVRGQR
ncbi:hypothetical protein L218DRAFT_930785 [Marasmius fiardii PR-910]|nr:hypothetical protein L218DRAFT_930785 [Marasmius fiardii PR-910]